MKSKYAKGGPRKYRGQYMQPLTIWLPIPTINNLKMSAHLFNLELEQFVSNSLFGFNKIDIVDYGNLLYEQDVENVKSVIISTLKSGISVSDLYMICESYFGINSEYLGSILTHLSNNYNIDIKDDMVLYNYSNKVSKKLTLRKHKDKKIATRTKHNVSIITKQRRNK